MATTDRYPEPAERTPRLLMVVVVGLAVGCATSFGQAHLDQTLNPLVNSASAWLVAPFVVGALMATRGGAAGAGLVTCALQVVGYYATAHLRSIPASHALIVFWTVCALVGGPLFGVAGHLWRAGPPALRGLGAAVLAAAFVAEGLWSYVHELRYYGAAALWLGLGAALAIGLNLARGGLGGLRWLALTLPLGLAGEIALTLIYRQSF